MAKAEAAGDRRSAARHRWRRWSVLLLVVTALATTGAMLFWNQGPLSGLLSAGSASSEGVPLDPSAFATGSCMAFEPTSGDLGKTVFLDAGHGGIDPGGVGTTESGQAIDEATETLPVELDVMALLRAKGLRVVVSRTGPSTVLRLGPADVDGGLLTLQGAHDDVAARDECANLANADVLVGIYYDAGSSYSEAGSLTAYDTDRPFAASNERLATLLQSDVVAEMNAQGWDIPDDGPQTDSQLGSFDGNASSGGIAAEAAAYNHLLLLGPAAPGFFSTPSQMPGAVIEPLYLTDPFEGSIAASARGQQVIAQSIAKAIEQYLGVHENSSSTGQG
ncbi:MAG: N-acetylmuramoyl-L-alanine amidase family protein [Acidimicrobiales bacterium]